MSFTKYKTVMIIEHIGGQYLIQKILTMLTDLSSQPIETWSALKIGRFFCFLIDSKLEGKLKSIWNWKGYLENTMAHSSSWKRWTIGIPIFDLSTLLMLILWQKHHNQSYTSASSYLFFCLHFHSYNLDYITCFLQLFISKDLANSTYIMISTSMLWFGVTADGSLENEEWISFW